MLLHGGTIALDELQFNTGGNKNILKELLSKNSGSIVPYIISLMDYLISTIPIVSSSLEVTLWLVLWKKKKKKKLFNNQESSNVRTNMEKKNLYCLVLLVHPTQIVNSNKIIIVLWTQRNLQEIEFPDNIFLLIRRRIWWWSLHTLYFTEVTSALEASTCILLLSIFLVLFFSECFSPVPN